jgi:hypothetical protein
MAKLTAHGTEVARVQKMAGEREYSVRSDGAVLRRDHYSWGWDPWRICTRPKRDCDIPKLIAWVEGRVY